MNRVYALLRALRDRHPHGGGIVPGPHRDQPAGMVELGAVALPADTFDLLLTRPAQREATFPTGDVNGRPTRWTAQRAGRLVYCERVYADEDHDDEDDGYLTPHPLTRPIGSDAAMFIQWKGTDACLDFYCDCGATCHYDGLFAYELVCPACDQCYSMGTQVIARKTTATNNAKLMECDDDLEEGDNP